MDSVEVRRLAENALFELDNGNAERAREALASLSIVGKCDDVHDLMPNEKCPNCDYIAPGDEQLQTALASDVRDFRDIMRQLEPRAKRAAPHRGLWLLLKQAEKAMREGCSECNDGDKVCGYGSCGFDFAADMASAGLLLAKAMGVK